MNRMPKLVHAVLVAALAIATCQAQASQDKQNDFNLHLQRAQGYLRDKRPDLAIQEYEAAIAIDPSNVDAQANLGVLLYFHHDYEKATLHLRAAVEAQPDLWKIEALLGLADYRLKDAAHARPELEASFSHLKGEKVQNEAGEALIDIYNASGDLDKAARVVAVLLEAQPTDARLLKMSYRLYSDLASNAILTLALAAPHSAEMYEVMARELARHGDDQAAIANYRAAIQANPKLPGVYFELGSLLYDSSEEKLQAEAEAEFQAALAANPDDEKSLLMLGKVDERKGDLKAAYDADSRAVALQPDDPDACTELAKLLINMDQRDKARRLLEHATAIDPEDPTAHYRLSVLDRQEGKQEEAKKELAEYQKYKAIKDKLRDLFHEMRVRMDDRPEDNGGMQK